MSRSHLIAIALIGLFCTSALQAELPKTFLKQNCYKCHGPDKQKAKRRFDVLPASINDFLHQEQWQGIVDQLNLGEMPPEDEKQPSQEERLAAVKSMPEAIAGAREKFAGKGRQVPAPDHTLHQ